MATTAGLGKRYEQGPRVAAAIGRRPPARGHHAHHAARARVFQQMGARRDDAAGQLAAFALRHRHAGRDAPATSKAAIRLANLKVALLALLTLRGKVIKWRGCEIERLA
jgi:hypothetical protein